MCQKIYCHTLYYVFDTNNDVKITRVFGIGIVTPGPKVGCQYLFESKIASILNCHSSTCAQVGFACCLRGSDPRIVQQNVDKEEMYICRVGILMADKNTPCTFHRSLVAVGSSVAIKHCQ